MWVVSWCHIVRAREHGLPRLRRAPTGTDTPTHSPRRHRCSGKDFLRPVGCIGAIRDEIALRSSLQRAWYYPGARRLAPRASSPSSKHATLASPVSNARFWRRLVLVLRTASRVASRRGRARATLRCSVNCRLALDHALVPMPPELPARVRGGPAMSESVAASPTPSKA